MLSDVPCGTSVIFVRILAAAWGLCANYPPDQAQQSRQEKHGQKKKPRQIFRSIGVWSEEHGRLTLTLEVQVGHRQGVGLDKVPTRLYGIAHQGVEDLIGSDRVFDTHLEHAAYFRVHGGFPELIRVHFAETLIALDAMALGAFGHQPGQCILEGADVLLALAALHKGTFFQQAVELIAQGGNGLVVVTGEEVAVEDDVAGNPMGNQFHLRQPEVTLLVFVQTGFVHQTGLLHTLEARIKQAQPLLHGCLVRQLLGFHARDVDEVLGELQRVQTRQTVEGLHHQAVIVDQTLQRLARQARRAFVDVQAGIFQSRLGHVFIHGLVVLDVLLLLALLDLVQRRLSDIDVATLDQLRQLTEEEGQQQGTDVRTVDVGVGHDDDVVVAQLVDVVLIAADTTAQGGDQGADFLGGNHLVETRFLDVENLALQRQDRLGLAVTALLGRTARGVPFHDIEFGKGRVFLLAVGQFTRQPGDIQRAFTASHFTSFTRRFTGTRGVDHLADYGFGFVGVFQQEVGEVLAHFLLDSSFHFAGNQLVFGLRAELRVRYFYRNDRSQTFTSIVTGGGDLVLLCQTFLLDIGIQVTRQCRTEAGQVGTAVALGNVVGEAQQVLVEAVVPLQGDFYADTVFTLHGEVEHLVDRGFVVVEVFNEGTQTAFVLEQLFLATAFILEQDAHAGVEERQFAQTLGQNVTAEMDIGEGVFGRFEVDLRTGDIAVADRGDRCLRHAVDIGLLPDLANTADGQDQLLGQGVNHRNAHAVQTTVNLIAVVVELTACVQDGHDHFRSGNAFFLVHIDRNTTAVIAHADRLIRVDVDGDFRSEEQTTE